MNHLLDGENFSLHYCNWSWIRWVSALGNKHRSKLVVQIEITYESVAVLAFES
jgi:hypothetical protein